MTRPSRAKGGESGLNPLRLLGAALDRLVDAGAMPPERRPGAEFLAWSAVHGLALLIIDAPCAGRRRRRRWTRWGSGSWKWSKRDCEKLGM